MTKLHSVEDSRQPAAGHFKKRKIVYAYFLCITMALLSIFTPAGPARAWDRPFNNAANWMGTGLMEIPNARVLEDGYVRVGYAQAKPYRWYGGAMGVFPGLEVGFVLTELTNIEALGPDYGNYKDKAVFAKYQVLSETRLLPAISLGIFDFHGTRLFQSEYVVISRQVFPFDFTLGYGRKRLKGDVTLPPSNDVGIFGGIEWALHDRLILMAEFNPVEYEKDDPTIRAVPEGADTPVNFGLRYKPLPGIELGLSYQRGHEIGFMANVQFELGQEIVPKKPDPWFWGHFEDKPSPPEKTMDRLQSIKEEIENSGFSNVAVYDNGATLTAELENTKYLYHQKAVGRLFRILFFLSSEDTRTLEVVLEKRQIPLLSVSVSREHFHQFLFGKISEEKFLHLVRTNLCDSRPAHSRNGSLSSIPAEKLDYTYGIKPDFDLYLNDPSGFFKFRFGIKPYGSATVWKGGAVHARLDIPFYTDIDSSNTPLPDAVRSDYWTYVDDENYTFERLLFDQAVKLSRRTFARVSFGYLEQMYAGTNGEFLAFLGDGSLAVGVEGDWVVKREQDTWFDLKNFERHTILGNLYYWAKPFDITLHAQYGRFLAGDIGWRFDVGRSYANGVEIGFWYSITDTDDLTGFNKDYHDKGVYVSVPVRILTDYETNRKYSYGISPWTRDVAATVYHWQSLYRMAKDLMPGTFKADVDRMTQ